MICYIIIFKRLNNCFNIKILIIYVINLNRKEKIILFVSTAARFPISNSDLMLVLIKKVKKKKILKYFKFCSKPRVSLLTKKTI